MSDPIGSASTARDGHCSLSSHDFGNDLVPSLIGKARIFAHRFATSCVDMVGDRPCRRGVHLQRSIVDKGCALPDGLQAGVDPLRDLEGFEVTERGITLITASVLGH